MTQDAEEARNQAEADSEVSQINTQPPPAPAANEENIRYSSMSSATPSLRKKGEVAQVIAPYEATSSEQLSLTRGQLIMIRKKTDSGWWEGELQVRIPLGSYEIDICNPFFFSRPKDDEDKSAGFRQRM